MQDMNCVKIKYHDKDLEKIRQLPNGDWCDLRSAEDVELKQGENKIISLGVSMELPEGYEAHIAPRSSTFKNWGILLTNSVGVVDNSYCGDGDIWKASVYATRDTVIKKNDRILQFRIMEKMKPLQFVEVEKLTGKERGGFGSTGTN